MLFTKLQKFKLKKSHVGYTNLTASDGTVMK